MERVNNMKKRVRAFISCYICGVPIEVMVGRSPEEQAISKGWTKVSMKSLELEEHFFICPKCRIRFIEMLKRM